MNRQIRTLFRVTAVGFAVMITMTAYWQIWASDSLATRRDNARLVYRQLQIKRGLILASNGHTVLAKNRKRRKDGMTIYTRVYPFGGLFAHVVGYNTIGQGRGAASSWSENDYLTASNVEPGDGNPKHRRHPRGRDRDRRQPGHQPVAARPAGGAGRDAGQGGRAAVALDPHTFRVLAMYQPTFNPNTVVASFLSCCASRAARRSSTARRRASTRRGRRSRRSPPQRRSTAASTRRSR